MSRGEANASGDAPFKADKFADAQRILIQNVNRRMLMFMSRPMASMLASSEEPP
jgi:hypothetical protein